MSADTAVALITLSGVILTAIVGLAGTVLTVWLSGRKDRAQQRRIETDRHEENRGRLDQMAATIEHLQEQLPDGGLDAWTRTVADHTEQLRRGALALDRLAESMTTVTERLNAHDAEIAALRAGGTA